VEDTRRTLRQGTFFGTENENEIGKENADQFERSSKASKNGIPYTNGTGSQGLRTERELRESQEERKISWERWWEFEPNVGRVANGIPKRVDRLKGLGNSLVPAIPYIIGQSILREEYI
jgi:DNA (cytosine-5)-methyltransferase 1